MKNIRVLLADDDAGMRLIMKRFLERAGGFELIGEAKDGQELIRLNEELSPEVIVLDVEMPFLSGVECARVIQDMNPKTILVFATAHEKYMSDAFQVYAFDYLIKPFSLDRVMKTLAMIKMRLDTPAEGEIRGARVNASGPAGRLMLKHREGITFANTEDILLVQREERATAIYLKSGEKLVCGDSLSEIEERLPKEQFFRTHKSYIVGLNHIQSISPYGRWTYIVKLRGTAQDALITSEKLEMLENMFQ